MKKGRMMGMAAALLVCAAAWGQPVGAVRGQGKLAMNGRAVQRSGTATYLKAGDEVAVQTGKAVVDLIGGTRLYLDAGTTLKLEAGSEGALGVRMLSGNGAFRLGEGASMAGVSGARQGLIAVERTLARVYPMVSMLPVADAGAGRAAATVPPIRSVDVSTSTLPPAPPKVGESETPKQSGPVTPNTLQNSLFSQSNGQTPAPIFIPNNGPGLLPNFTILLPRPGTPGPGMMSLSNDSEALWWLAGAPTKGNATN